MNATCEADPNALTREEAGAEIARWQGLAWREANRACRKFRLPAGAAEDVHAEVMVQWCRAAKLYRKDNERGASFGTYVTKYAWRAADVAAQRIVKNGLRISRGSYDAAGGVQTGSLDELRAIEFPNGVTAADFYDPVAPASDDPDGAELWEVVRSVLSPREWFVVEQRLLRGRRLRELGREMGVCKERVRQIQEAAIKKLRDALPGWDTRGAK